MVRPAVFLGLALCLLPAVAMAGQASSTFTAGIAIGGAGRGPVKTYTWGAAAVSVREAGFTKPKRVAESGTLYWFEAERGGSTFRIAVSITFGEIVKVIPA